MYKEKCEKELQKIESEYQEASNVVKKSIIGIVAFLLMILIILIIII